MHSSISILIPCYNEEKYISNLIGNIIGQINFNSLVEVFFIDGGSIDGTVEIIKKWAKENSNIFLLDNPKKYVPQALNLGLQKATGDFIIRLDAHTIYSSDYIQKIIETFEKTGADIVGGPMNPVGNGTFQKAVAAATTSVFGVGNSKFHDIQHEGFVDTVYLGAWRKTVFQDVGYFDEQMKRNQDDEFHYRAKSRGKTIYLNPEIRSTYFPRDSFTGLFKQYFQYGLYKPLVIYKNKSEIKLRHLIPLFFAVYVLSIPFIISHYILLAPLVLYFAIDIVVSLKIAEDIAVKASSILVFPTLHFSYGFGFLLGLFKLIASKK